MNQIIDWLDKTSMILFFSLFGGVALAAKTRERTAAGVFCCCIVAMFTGTVTGMLIDEFALRVPISENLKYACVSLAAVSGGEVIDRWIGRMAAMLEAVFGKHPKP